MYAVSCNIAAIVLMGLVVKGLDDILDEPVEYMRQYVPYMLAAGSLALALNFELAFSLFWASYAIGMFSFPTQYLPSRTYAWVEILVSLGLLYLITGLGLAVWSLVIILAVQLIDDLIDSEYDLVNGNSSFLRSIGIVETMFLALAFMYAAVAFLPIESVVVLVSALVISNLNGGDNLVYQ